MKKEKKLTQEELAAFCSQLSLLLPAGITPYEAIIFMKEDTPTEKGKESLEQIEAALKDGLSFYDALKNSCLFPDYVTSMILLGEESGNLDIVIQKLADYYEQQCSITSSIKNAISYPMIMIGLMLVILSVLLAKILPIFNQVFIQLGSELNGIAARLLFIGNLIESISSGIIVVTVSLILILLISYHSTKFKGKWLHFFHTNRFTKNFFLGIAYTRFASAMSMITSSGIDLFRGLQLARILVNHELVSKKIDICSEAISSGDYLHEALKKADLFQAKHIRMLQIGQRSGEIGTVLDKISAYYEEETLSKLHKILGAIEPTLVIFFSLMVGLILLSVIMPLIGIMSNIG